MKSGIEGILALSVVGAVLAGCNTDETGASVTPEAAACADYCEAAGDVRCSIHGDCQTECLSMFELGCKSLLMDLLACMSAGLTSECVPRDGAGKLDCAGELASYDGCVPIDFGVPLETCGSSAAESETPASGCQGGLVCDGLRLDVQCDAAGACTCLRDGVAVGTCNNIASSAYFCAPHESCCTPIFLSK